MSTHLLSVLPGVWVGLAVSVVLRAVEVLLTVVLIFVPRVVLLAGLAAVVLGWIKMAVVEVLGMAELEGMLVPPLGNWEMVSRIQSVNFVILEYTPGLIAWAQPNPQLTMPAR